MALTACRRDKKKDELLSMDPEKITYEIVSDKQRAIAQARGKRGTDRFDQLEMLQFLAKVSKGPVQEIEVRQPPTSTSLYLRLRITSGST